MLARLNLLAHLRHGRAGALAQVIELEAGSQSVALDEPFPQELAGPVAE